ncbi:coiled-coil domain-containing protein 34 [Antennarius striatus]|uniref:coiled-coil domain-containing protein 34 n=1 Tax=Antennarius striatus TaxID=241820 RepID=UPI0035B18B1A
MPGGRMPNCPSSVSKGFSSTPVKTSQEKDYNTSQGLDDDDVLSDDEDTFSLLSPIYHDSFDSDEESSPIQLTSPSQNEDSTVNISSIRCEPPKTPSELMLTATMEPATSPTLSLSPWEMWLVNKAREDRVKSEKKAAEELLCKEKLDQQEREHEQKKIAMEKNIQEWLKMKTEQEKHKLLLKKSKEEEEKQGQQDRQKETEQKAQQKYKTWLQKKNQEKIEVEKKEKEEAALKAEQEKERRKRAEMRFQEWLTKDKEKNKSSPNAFCHPTSPYDRLYPSPSFCNPLPWKPVPTPPPEKTHNKTSDMKAQRQRKCQQSSSATLRLKNIPNVGQSVQRR